MDGWMKDRKGRKRNKIQPRFDFSISSISALRSHGGHTHPQAHGARGALHLGRRQPVQVPLVVGVERLPGGVCVRMCVASKSQDPPRKGKAGMREGVVKEGESASKIKTPPLMH